MDADRHRNRLAKQLQGLLARNLRLLRKARGLTQEEFAAISGVAPRHLQKMEAGEVNITLKTLGVLANSYDVEASELLSVKFGTED